MKSKFAEYATATAFIVKLSKLELLELQKLSETLRGAKDNHSRRKFVWADGISIWRLYRKGLVSPYGLNEKSSQWSLTLEGRALVFLLHTSGLLHLESEQAYSIGQKAFA